MRGLLSEARLLPQGWFQSAHLAAFQPAGSLAGACLVVFFSVALLVGTLGLCAGRIPRAAAALYFAVYAVYVGYEVLATYGAVAPVCFGATCI